jgi:hypothetical protein
MPNRLSYLELLMWFIILFQCVAVLLQTAKISKAIAHKKPYGLNGISFWAFAFWTFFIIPGIVWEIFKKKSISVSFYYLISTIGFFIPCTILIIIYYKNLGYVNDLDSNKKDDHILEKKKIAPDEWKKYTGIFVGLTIASCLLTYLIYTKTKYFGIMSQLSSIGVGLCFLPFTIHLFKYGDQGISILFLVLTLIGNVALMVGALGNNWILVLLMMVYIVLKNVSFGKIYAISQKAKTPPDEPLKSASGMKKMLGLLIGGSVGLSVILLGAKKIDNR